MAPLAATEAREIAAIRLTGPNRCFAYVAILPSVVAHMLYNAAVRDIGAGGRGR
ncbi:MAG TPA: hypothetical protein VF463_12685 [Sphingobium sp.]